MERMRMMKEVNGPDEMEMNGTDEMEVNEPDKKDEGREWNG